ncbi:MAG: cysteine desulfurase family protein [Candidatus Nanopelagicales bacterium]
MSRSYLDAASGQPLHPAAMRMIEGFANRDWADPHAGHHEARRSRQLLDAARQTVAAVLDLPAAAIWFRNAGLDAATEAIAGLGWALAQEDPDTQVTTVCTAVERATVLEAAGMAGGAPEVVVLDVDGRGVVNLGELEQALTVSPRSTLACVQAGNLEVGSRQPLAEVSRLCRAAGVPLTVDGTGVLGHADIPTGWDGLFADASSFAGPRGMAIVALRPGTRWSSPRDKTGPGLPTDVEDVAGAIATAAALDAVYRTRREESARLADLVALIRNRVPQLVSDVEVLGDPDWRLPNTVTFSVLYADGEQLGAELDRLGFAVGSGSACASRAGLPSHVLAAIGALTHGNVRVSLPLGCTSAQVDHFLAALPGAVEFVRREAGAPM